MYLLFCSKCLWRANHRHNATPPQHQHHHPTSAIPLRAPSSPLPSYSSCSGTKWGTLPDLPVHSGRQPPYGSSTVNAQTHWATPTDNEKRINNSTTMCMQAGGRSDESGVMRARTVGAIDNKPMEKTRKEHAKTGANGWEQCFWRQLCARQPCKRGDPLTGHA